MSLESLISYETPFSTIEGILVDKRLRGSLTPESEKRCLYEENQRLQSKLDAARQNPNKYAPLIRKYEAKIADNTARIAQLEGGTETAGGGDGRPPRRGSSIPLRDDYQAEKQQIRRYFSVPDIKAVLLSEQDMVHAAMGLRLLDSMGKKLDNYEIHIPADYRLELLKRAGRFCEEANVFQRIQQGKIKMFGTPEKLGGGYIFRATPTPPDKSLKDGFSREGEECLDCYEHVHNYPSSDLYISTSKATDILKAMFFKPVSEGGMGLTQESLKTKPLYVYVINPRALMGVDIENSAETFKLPAPDDQKKWAFEQQEVGVIGRIDHRDVKGCLKVEYDGQDIKLKYFSKNEAYISSGWEMNIDFKNLRLSR